MRGEIANQISAVLDTRGKSMWCLLTKEKGRVLVAFFGDNTYGWLEPENVVPFECHFDEKSKQSEDHLFLAAVEEAFLSQEKICAWIDLKYSIEQIKKARNGFKPREMVSFLQKLALNPTINTRNNFTFTRNVARVLAYRKSVFEEPDETYPQEFEAQAVDSEHHADVSYGKKPDQVICHEYANPLKSHSEFSESADALVIMGKHSPFAFTLDAINLYSVSCLHFHVIDDIAKQAKLKVPEIGIQNESLRKNVSQKKDNSMPQLRIFDSDDLSRSNKKRSSPDVQEDTVTNKQKKGKTIDSMLARKKVVDNQYSDLRGDQISTKTTVVANHEERSTEQIESLIEDTEQTVMTIKFFHPARMPSVQHVKEEFANLGPLMNLLSAPSRSRRHAELCSHASPKRSRHIIMVCRRATCLACPGQVTAFNL
ncbi:UNVERIFIED_CONTAM: hypothetical protein Scaly_2855900 [Sesamum calycinum]|uniref:PWWP domain-containing protein n=1 Tax=Sesamum calycinum TaxID=2727403 RepID=A0AAW2LIX9_9LAMI